MLPIRKLINLLLVLLILLCSGCQESFSPAENAVSSLPVEGQLTLWMLDVGQGDCLLVQSPAGKFMLIDGGPGMAGEQVTSTLQQLGVKELAVLVVSHPHEDHIGGLENVLDTLTVKQAYLPEVTTTTQSYRALWQGLKRQETRVNMPRAGDMIDFDPAITVKVMGPVKSSYEELNDNSLVIEINYGETSFLLTGDVTEMAEEDIVNSGIQPITVLKVAHHGSNHSTSRQFLAQIRPAVALISVGEGNDYGHPGQQTISRLQTAGVPIYRTDQQGLIRVVSNGQQVQVYTEKKTTATPNTVSSWVGNRKSLVLHKGDCDHLPALNNRVIFSDQSVAQKEGYRLCARCFPNQAKEGRP